MGLKHVKISVVEIKVHTEYIQVIKFLHNDSVKIHVLAIAILLHRNIGHINRTT